VIIRDMLPRSINTYHEWNVMIYRVLPLSIVALLSSGCLICPTEYTSTNSCPELNRVIGVIGSQSEVEDNADAAYHELFRLPIEESPSAWLNIINADTFPIGVRSMLSVPFGAECLAYLSRYVLLSVLRIQRAGGPRTL